MVEGFTDNSPMYPMKSTPIKKPSDGKSMCLFTTIFEVKNKTAFRRSGAAKSKRKAIEFGNKLWALKKSEK